MKSGDWVRTPRPRRDKVPIQPPLPKTRRDCAFGWPLFFGLLIYAERGDSFHGEEGFRLFHDVVKRERSKKSFLNVRHMALPEKHTPIVQPTRRASSFHVPAPPAGFDLPGDRHDPGRNAAFR